MTPETPLTEVAQHLPTEAAAHLHSQTSDIQVAVLEHVRSALVYMQELNPDPISMAAFLNAHVIVLTGLVGEIIELNLTVDELTASLDEQLSRAEGSTRRRLNVERRRKFRR